MLCSQSAIPAHPTKKNISEYAMAEDSYLIYLIYLINQEGEDSC